ncbi:MAG TPA: tRNA uridine-5-carboxymethylaminomethyl(34) synthesis GTPase MnmE [Clostridiaceae bacterium]|jgi:tRNA modification GTPase|nr:tRNA uridine-5-carboxymethylaminomethyl(34) synthesis GTPase MnmE [Clostridiaceae bacterium]HBX47867.1 tRNA uridine-5-carboxymethylaminomethyl(34) synthesis GTPase MnmE [Clostridiaceae bacterium]
MLTDDTIAAISTALGEGGIGIVRISGDKSMNILKKVFKSAKGKDVSKLHSYSMMHGYIIDPKTNEKIDEVIVSYMKKPSTYTREDVVEINCHGGVIAVRRVLQLTLDNGARLAEPGEFTKRAFLNGRIDLSQAEAVMDLIRAKTDESMKIALEQSEGKLSKQVEKINNKILDILAHIEAEVEFSEEDIDEVVNEKVIKDCEEVKGQMEDLLKNADKGKILREGLNVIIVGKPNVGKSSLLNALLEEKRAIVTDVPGTTRDTIEEYINIDGIPVKLIDTAGIREARNEVEKIGVERTKECIDKADLILFMIDGSREIDDEDMKIVEIAKNRDVIVIINKHDLPMNVDIEYIKKTFYNKPVLYVSVKTNEGVSSIKEEITNFVYKGKVSVKDIYVTNIRHKKALNDAIESIENGITTIKNGYPIDMASIDIKDAYLKLGEITGKTVSEDIIDRIFTNFCIGK